MEKKLPSTSYLNESKIKFLQIIQGTIEKHIAKNMKRDSVRAYVNTKHDSPLPLYATVRILGDSPGALSCLCT